MKPQHLSLVILGLFSAGCGNSISAPASEAKGIVGLAYDYHASSPERSEHLKEVASKIKFDGVEYKGKRQVAKDDDSDCGWSKCMKWEDSSRCMVRYTIEDEWGILPYEYDCEGNAAEEQKTDALKRAKNSISYMHTSGQIVMDEVEYSSRHLSNVAAKTLSFNSQVGEGYNALKCINDIVGTMSDVINEHSEWGCDTEWTGEMLAEREGTAKKIAKLQEQIADLNCDTMSEDEKDSCVREKAGADNQLSLTKAKETWIKTLEGNDARMYALVNFRLGKTCLNKNLHSNSNYSENFFLSEAFQQCLDYSLGSGSSVGGYKTNGYDGSSEYKEPAAQEYKGPVTADDIKEDYDYKAPSKKKRSRSGKKRKRDYKGSKRRYRR